MLVPRFFLRTILGASIFAVLTGALSAYFYDTLRSWLTPHQASQSSPTSPVEEIDLLLQECHKVSPNIARFVVIPTTVTGAVSDFVLRFNGVLGDRVASVRHAGLREGLEKRALRLYTSDYTFVLKDKDGQVVLRRYGKGPEHFDMEKKPYAGDFQVGFARDYRSFDRVEFEGMLTAALTGRCNLLNIVML